jgi:hypothetical protein
MLPSWQIAGLIVLVLVAIVAAIDPSSKSYAYVFIAGQ